MTIELSPDRESLIERKVASGCYGLTGDVLAR